MNCISERHSYFVVAVGFWDDLSINRVREVHSTQHSALTVETGAQILLLPPPTPTTQNLMEQEQWEQVLGLT